MMLFAEIDASITERVVSKFLEYGILGIMAGVGLYYFIQQMRRSNESQDRAVVAHERFIEAQIAHMEKQEKVHEENSRTLKSIEDSNRQMARHIADGAVCKYVKGTTG